MFDFPFAFTVTHWYTWSIIINIWAEKFQIYVDDTQYLVTFFFNFVLNVTQPKKRESFFFILFFNQAI